MNELSYKTELLFGEIPDASWLPTCSLKLLIFPSKVYSILFSPGGKMIYGQLFVNEKGVPYSVFLRYLFLNEAFLRGTYLEMSIFEVESPFTLIPIQFAREAQRLELMHALVDDSLFTEEYNAQWIREETLEVLFVPDSGLCDVLKQFVPHHTLVHMVSAILNLSRKLQEEYPSHMLINLYETQLMITVIKEKQLQICQSYPWASHLDIVYFIQLINEMTGWKETEVPLFIMGEISNSDIGQSTLWEYIPGLSIPSVDNFDPDLKEHTEWWRYGVLFG